MIVVIFEIYGDKLFVKAAVYILDLHYMYYWDIGIRADQTGSRVRICLSITTSLTLVLTLLNCFIVVFFFLAEFLFTHKHVQISLSLSETLKHRVNMTTT